VKRPAAKRKIGTTGRGVLVLRMEDKVSRPVVCASRDLFHRERFAPKLVEVLDYHNFAYAALLQGRAGRFPETPG